MNEQERKKWQNEAFNFLNAYLKIILEDLEKARRKTFWIFGKEKVRQVEEKVERSKKAIEDLANGKSALAIEIIDQILSSRSVSPFQPPSPVDKFLDNCRHRAALMKIKEALQTV